jgi:hypothetical protein
MRTRIGASDRCCHLTGRELQRVAGASCLRATSLGLSCPVRGDDPGSSRRRGTGGARLHGCARVWGRQDRRRVLLRVQSCRCDPRITRRAPWIRRGPVELLSRDRSLLGTGRLSVRGVRSRSVRLHPHRRFDRWVARGNPDRSPTIGCWAEGGHHPDTDRRRRYNRMVHRPGRANRRSDGVHLGDVDDVALAPAAERRFHRRRCRLLDVASIPTRARLSRSIAACGTRATTTDHTPTR